MELTENVKVIVNMEKKCIATAMCRSRQCQRKRILPLHQGSLLCSHRVTYYYIMLLKPQVAVRCFRFACYLIFMLI